MSTNQIRFGLDTFGDSTVDAQGNRQSDAQTIRNVVEQAVLADKLDLDAFNVGEHHREDYAITAPDTVLAGIATVTNKITLGTGVTVLSSDDPVRVYERFATLDALSNGRAEITAGRGSFIESFPLFGYNLNDYHALFEEKLELLVELFKEQPVTWSGTTRASLTNQSVWPKTEGGRMPIRVGVGGSPESVVRAARLQLPLALAIIGGDPARFAPFAKLYRDQLREFGFDSNLPVSIHSPGYCSMYVRNPETVAKKIAYAINSLGAQRFDFKYSNGPVPHDRLMRNIELYATEVVPRVKRMLAGA